MHHAPFSDLFLGALINQPPVPPERTAVSGHMPLFLGAALSSPEKAYSCDSQKTYKIPWDCQQIQQCPLVNQFHGYFVKSNGPTSQRNMGQSSCNGTGATLAAMVAYHDCGWLPPIKIVILKMVYFWFPTLYFFSSDNLM